MPWLSRHIAAHPFRLLLTVTVMVFFAWGLAGYALIRSLDASHNANVTICRSLNELRRELYVAAADIGVPAHVRERFLPTEDCEDLP